MWHLRTFGGLSIEIDHGTAKGLVARRRSLALLALLAVAGERGLSREKVVALLWPESDEEHGRNSLSQSLATLRREMAADDPVLGAAELRLNPQVVTSDVREFEQFVASGALERAAALYRGPFLDGFFVREASDFERWADDQRRRLHEMCAQTLGRLARSADERSDRETAVAWWKRFTALEPTSAPASLGLMRALVGLGDRAGARQHYRVYEQLMRQELGVVPEPAVASFAESIFTDLTDLAVPNFGAAGERPTDGAPTARSRIQQLATIAAATNDANGAVSARFRHTHLTSRVAMICGLIALVAMGAAGFMIERRDGDVTGDSSSAAHRVVIRTFRNNSGDPSLDPLGLMAADWIARGLTETPSVDVAGTESDIVARDSGSKSPALDPIALGRLMRARYVISGSYYTQGDSLFLQAEVSDASAGRRVLSIAPVGSVMRAKLGILEQLRQRVTGALVPYFDSSIVTAGRVPPKYEAYEEFLLGTQTYETNRPASVAHLLAAARLDPTFMYAQLKLISQFQVKEDFAARDSVIAEVEKMRDKMSAYEGAAFDVRVAIAHSDYDAAYQAAMSGQQLVPHSTYAAFELGEIALLVGRPHETVRLLEPLDPESGALRNVRGYYWILCRAYHVIERDDDMRRCYDRARRQYGDIPRVLYANGVFADAKAVETWADSIVPRRGYGLAAAGGLFELAVHGHPGEARAIAQRALVHLERSVGDTVAPIERLNLQLSLFAYLSEWRELARVFDTTPQPSRSDFALSLRGVASAMLGDTTDARRRLVAIKSVDGYHQAAQFNRVRILAALGDKAAALAALRKLGAPQFYSSYHPDMIYRLMRGYPPFDDFLKPRD
ncbi:MAG TPA: BTAD domain-containing putative transcriptional regulator [Gemmatimonadaceae bacterium]|nr:BTAD domain-containing putative transcriptional regulator [Gemmatimonadaceae bacterium]